MKHLIYTSLLAVTTIGMSSCVSRLATHISPESIPQDVSATTLLIQEYQYTNPEELNTFGQINVDSLQKATGFVYDVKEIYPDDKNQEHPLVIETNQHLEEYNSKLLKTLEGYKFPYSVVNDRNIVVMNYEMQGIDEGQGTIGGMDENTALQVERYCSNSTVGQFKYALIRKPVSHCYVDPEEMAQESYRYEYYFQNLQTGETYPAIEVYSTDPNRTLKAIIHKINKGRFQASTGRFSLK